MNYRKMQDDARYITVRNEDAHSKWYMPYNINAFEELLKKALNLHPTAKNFLDVGSGAGDKVLFAKNSGLDAYGLEMSPSLVDYSRRFVKIYEVDIKKFNSYNNFDIIYIWNPLPHEECSTGVLRRMLSQVKGKTVIISIPPTNNKVFLNTNWVEKEDYLFTNF